MDGTEFAPFLRRHCLLGLSALLPTLALLSAARYSPLWRMWDGGSARRPFRPTSPAAAVRSVATLIVGRRRRPRARGTEPTSGAVPPPVLTATQSQSYLHPPPPLIRIGLRLRARADYATTADPYLNPTLRQHYLYRRRRRLNRALWRSYSSPTFFHCSRQRMDFVSLKVGLLR